MSFFEVLKVVGKGVLSVAGFASPFVGLVNPAAGAVLSSFVTKVQSSIIANEAIYSDVKSGSLKSQATIDAFVADIALTQEVLNLSGQHLIYDQSKLKEAIDAQVLAYNKFAELKQSFKVEKLS